MKRKIAKALNLAFFFVYNRITMIFKGLDEKKVLFLSEAHFSLNGNLKAVYDKLGTQFEKKVYVKPDRRQGERIKEKVALWKDLTTAKYIILDDFYGLTSAMKLRKNQELVQLWHGSGAFKKFGFSRTNTGDNITNINSGYRKYTKAAVTSEEVRPCFAEAFGISIDKVQAVGSPRTDMFFDKTAIKNMKEKIHETYPTLRDKKVVLIAPTYRGKKVEDASYPFERLKLKELAKELGDEYQIITKWHPALYNNIMRGICQNPATEDVLDVSAYSDINDLLLVTDILVTDYSSVIFDYFLLDKPVVYFIYDQEDYQIGRGLYFDFDNYIYGDIAENYEGLVEAIKNEKIFEEKRNEFNNKFMNTCDGNSTDRVIEWVFGRE